jgi:hypothetical protein
MHCKELSIDYPDYVRNKVEPSKQAEIDRHLSSCNACTCEVADLRGLFEALDSDKERSNAAPDWTRFLVEINARIDKPARRRFSVSPAALRLLAPAGAAMAFALAILLFTSRPGDAPSAIISEEMRSVITSLDTNETALLAQMYIDPVTTPGALIPNGTHALDAVSTRDVESDIVFDGVPYTELLAASMDYLDQSTVIELLPVENSRSLMHDETNNGNL